MLQASDPKIVIVTRQTRMQAIRAKFNTRGMAQFAMQQNRQIELNRPGATQMADSNPGAVFEELDLEDQAYGSAVQQVRDELDLKDLGLHVQTIDRDFVPSFVFGPNDIVVTLGQDGLVANTAKYAVGLPIVAVNPDPARIDGILLPFKVPQARAAVRSVIQSRAKYREVTLAEVELTDGQRLLAFNDLFIGMRTHTSARYRIQYGSQSEQQSSSGVLVSTGAGSTGWLSSVFNMAAGVVKAFGGGGEKSLSPSQFPWEDPRLVYAVREPFASRTSGAELVAGTVDPGHELLIESLMSGNGVVFSDGIEADFLEFNSGATARIRTAQKKARLIVPGIG
jgi:NAD kinase